MHVLILLFSFFGCLLSGFLGNFFGSRGVSFFSTFCVFVSSLLSALLFFDVWFFGSFFTFYLCPWIYADYLLVHWGFLFDSLTSVMLVVITTISFFVHSFSLGYMGHDPHLTRFMSYLSFFTLFMLVLVSADNFAQMFVGWEGVGVCSYLLINFWFTRIQANKAAIKAILVNRVGDFGLSLGVFMVFMEFGSLDYTTVFVLVPYAQQSVFSVFGLHFYSLDCMSFFLFFGCIGKSAQLGLHSWLPDAIEGPTPVSALIHAATIVTAGVFLLVRCSPLFEFSPVILNFVTFVGSFTAFFAASVGLLQNDLKKVIAYSTCSQLGYIVFSCGLSGYQVSIFHLANHAFFKALLFLTAGCIIHAMSDEQDMRKFGGLAKIMPFSYSLMFIASFALMGFPFLSGFYSKDFILELAFGSFSLFGHFAYNLGVIAAGLTAFYSMRVLHITFLAKPLGYAKAYEQAHEGSLSINLPLFFLAFGSLYFGFFFKDLFVGYGSSFFSQAVFVHPIHGNLSDSDFLVLTFKLLPLFFSFVGFFSSFLINTFCNQGFFFLKRNKHVKRFYLFFIKKWFFDKVYNQLFSQLYLFSSYKKTYLFLDRGFFEFFGPYGFSVCVRNVFSGISRFQNGQVIDYLVFIPLVTFFVIDTFFSYYLGFCFLYDVRMLFVFVAFCFFS